jgi:hypothetical protein
VTADRDLSTASGLISQNPRIWLQYQQAVISAASLFTADSHFSRLWRPLIEVHCLRTSRL